MGNLSDNFKPSYCNLNHKCEYNGFEMLWHLLCVVKKGFVVLDQSEIFSIHTLCYLISDFEILSNSCFQYIAGSHHWPSFGTEGAAGVLAGCWASLEQYWDPSYPAWHFAVLVLMLLVEGQKLSPPSPPAAACLDVDHLDQYVLKK